MKSKNNYTKDNFFTTLVVFPFVNKILPKEGLLQKLLKKCKKS